jgi:hypothetical protein
MHEICSTLLNIAFCNVAASIGWLPFETCLPHALPPFCSELTGCSNPQLFAPQSPSNKKETRQLVLLFLYLKNKMR